MEEEVRISGGVCSRWKSKEEEEEEEEVEVSGGKVGGWWRRLK